MQFRGFNNEVQLFLKYEDVTNIQTKVVYGLGNGLIPVQRYNVDRQGNRQHVYQAFTLLYECRSVQLSKVIVYLLQLLSGAGAERSWRKCFTPSGNSQ